MEMEIENISIDVTVCTSVEPPSVTAIVEQQAAVVIGDAPATISGEDAQPGSPSLAAACAREGDNVILDENGEHQWSVKLRHKSKVKVGKAYVSISPLVDAPWGTVFQLSADGQKLEALTSPPEVDGFKTPGVSERDNSTLLDRNDANQALSAADIAEMRRSGKAGTDIIDALVTSSATFATKTEFSQDKYKRKKAKKYCLLVTMRRPTARALCQMHYDKGPDRVWNLRFDTLAIMLSLANVAAGAKVLVLESCQGVVTAAVTERLGGHGTCVATHLDAKFYAPLDAAKEMNLTPQERSIIRVATLGALLGAKDDVDTPAAVEAAQPLPDAVMQLSRQAATAAPEAPKADGGIDGAEQAGAGSTSAAAAAAGLQRGGEGQVAPPAGPGSAGGRHRDGPHTVGFTASAAELPGLVASGFSSVLLAAPKLHPGAVLSAVWPLLAPSASIVVYSCWPQPLAELFASLQQSRQAVLVQMHESWMRPHQVLPMRTHPEMSCSGTGGYILSATKVIAADDARPVWTSPASAAAPTAPTGATSLPAATTQPAATRDASGIASAVPGVDGVADVEGGSAGVAGPDIGGTDVAGAELAGGQGDGGRGGGRGRGNWGGRGGTGGSNGGAGGGWGRGGRDGARGKRHGDQRGGGGGKRGRR